MTTSHPQTSDHFLERGAVPCSCQPLALAGKIRHKNQIFIWRHWIYLSYLWCVQNFEKTSTGWSTAQNSLLCRCSLGETRSKTTTSIPPSWNKRLQQPSRLKSCKPHGPAVSSCHAAPALVIIEHHHNHHQHHNHKSNNRTLITYQNHHNQ